MFRPVVVLSFSVMLVAATGAGVAQADFWEPTAGSVSNNVDARWLAINRGDTIYAGGYSLFLSLDHGATWTELDISGLGIGVRSVAVNSKGHVFADIYGEGGWYAPAHICRSTDDGEHWTPLVDGLWRCALAFNESGHILIGSDEHLCRSTNGGETWDTLRWGDYRGVTALAIHPTGDYFAAISWRGIFRSTDHGASWDSVNNGLVDGYIHALDVSPAGDLYARYLTGYDTTHLFRSTDRGESWTLWQSLPTYVWAMLWTKNGDLYMASDSGVYRNNIQTNSGLAGLSVRSLAVDSHGYLYAGNGSVFRSVQPVTGVEQRVATMVPEQCVLEQNFPNPFNPKTVVRFQVPGVSDVKLAVYDLLGREVAVLVNERKVPARYEVTFGASGLASGAYVYRLTAGSYIDSRKMIVLK